MTDPKINATTDADVIAELGVTLDEQSPNTPPDVKTALLNEIKAAAEAAATEELTEAEWLFKYHINLNCFNEFRDRVKRNVPVLDMKAELAEVRFGPYLRIIDAISALNGKDNVACLNLMVDTYISWCVLYTKPGTMLPAEVADKYTHYGVSMLEHIALRSNTLLRADMVLEPDMFVELAPKLRQAHRFAVHLGNVVHALLEIALAPFERVAEVVIASTFHTALNGYKAIDKGVASVSKYIDSKAEYEANLKAMAEYQKAMADLANRQEELKKTLF